MSKNTKTDTDLWSSLEAVVDAGFDISFSRDDTSKRKPYSVVIASSDEDVWDEEASEVYEGRGSTLLRAAQEALDELKDAY